MAFPSINIQINRWSWYATDIYLDTYVSIAHFLDLLANLVQACSLAFAELLHQILSLGRVFFFF